MTVPTASITVALLLFFDDGEGNESALDLFERDARRLAPLCVGFDARSCAALKLFAS